MTDRAIEVNKLVKIYNGRNAVLDGISFSVNKGEFVTLYGPSGSGKTTLLNILGGLDSPTAGDVIIDGASICGLSEDELAEMRLQKIGFVFQDSNLLPDLTVRENIALPLRFSGIRDGGQVEEVISKLDIGHIADEIANKISGGETQRAAIARALMNEPTIILADEPTGNLDLENTRNVIETFNMVINDFGTTVMLATHDADLAEYATSKIFLSGGKVVLEVIR